MGKFITFSITALLSLSGWTTARSIPPLDSSSGINFNNFLDESLGNIPAHWITAQGALLELNAANGVNISPRTNTTATSDTDREKENGAALATFASGVLIPTYFHIQDDEVGKGLCKGFEASAASVVGSVVGQEVGKDLYGKNSTAPEFEQGVVPSLLGGMVGNSAGQALSRTLCNRFVPNYEDLFKLKSADAVAKMTRSLHQGLGQLLTAHLENLGVDTAKAVQCARQLEETIRLADRMTVVDA